MVIDTLEHASLYTSLHPLFQKAFEFLNRTDLNSLPDGKIQLDGDRLFASVQHYTTQPVSDGKMEAHRRYIDIQYVVSGEEVIGWAPLEEKNEFTPFDPEKDIGFYFGETFPETLKAGMFAILYPCDAHLPGRFLVSPSEVKKIVIKVAL